MSAISNLRNYTADLQLRSNKAQQALTQASAAVIIAQNAFDAIGAEMTNVRDALTTLGAS